MLTVIKLDNFTSLLEKIKDYKTTQFVWEFLREIDWIYDEFFVVFKNEWKVVIYSVITDNQTPLPDLSNIFYAADLYQNEIYDYYGRITKDFDNHILRLHTHPKDFFPLRKLWKPMVKKKKDFIFTTVTWEWLVEVPVWPIHAGIIPPGHFRFTVDWEDTLNLDTQMWWKHRWVEKYFYTQRDLNQLLIASQDIAWDSAVAYSIGFARLIEQAWKLSINSKTSLNRVLALEFERIYNHIWTIWALWNDVGQSFLLNWYLSIRENLLELNKELFGSRTLKWFINFSNTWKNIWKDKIIKIKDFLIELTNRLSTLTYIQEYSSWVYDRFKDTWIVNYQTAEIHSWLWLWAKASKIPMDERVYDQDYINNNIKVHPILWIQWDSFDRFQVRAKEIFQSIDIIKNVLHDIENLWNSKETNLWEIKLIDWIYTSFVEWHRWEIFQMIVVENWNIVYYKAKDPSFVNWSLLEYSVLKNIIADFPICNKSFDLSYSWFDM